MYNRPKSHGSLNMPALWSLCRYSFFRNRAYNRFSHQSAAIMQFYRQLSFSLDCFGRQNTVPPADSPSHPIVLLATHSVAILRAFQNLLSTFWSRQDSVCKLRLSILLHVAASHHGTLPAWHSIRCWPVHGRNSVLCLLLRLLLSLLFPLYQKCRSGSY